jgi:hypothetical protein
MEVGQIGRRDRGDFESDIVPRSMLLLTLCAVGDRRIEYMLSLELPSPIERCYQP